jgi:alkanesulfonate monooxygenase SsuD/methylene tetrahydromethanopterin reductase-like flavin-dependent oxidoreductase (luciferase family)
MDFAITFKGDIAPERTVALAKQAEVAGFKYAWFFDSHVLWRECYVMTALCMANTTKIKYGPLVTNPGVREWSVAASLFATLCAQSNNRFEVGLGRGDSSRRMLGKKPMTIANMVEFTHAIKGMVRGDNVQYQGTEAQ